jgi:hypothetical protein
VLFIVIVLLGHAAAIHFFSLRIAGSRTARTAQPMALPIRLVLTPLREEPAPQARSSNSEAPRSATSAVEVAHDARLEMPEESRAITLPSSDMNPDAGERRDWGAAAGRIAQQLVEAGSGPMQFGAAGEEEELREPAAPNFFELDSPRKAGYVEMLGPGRERRWINSRCYRDFGKPPYTIPGTRPDLNPINCMVGPGAVRSDLFDHLKPDNLKDQD